MHTKRVIPTKGIMRPEERIMPENDAVRCLVDFLHIPGDL